MTQPEVRIHEVGPRDGLQAEPVAVSLDAKLRYLALLADAGLRDIEATSLVRPDAVPQLADADELLRRLDRRPGVRYPVLVANRRGMERAVTAGVDAICLFTAASETYARRNVRMSIDASLAAFTPLAEEARRRGWWLRGYVSCAFGCPYEGEVDAAAVVRVAEALLAIGIDELAISDTVGAAAPSDVARVMDALRAAGIPLDALAFHFHDTRGTALANVLGAMDRGARAFDAAAGGTGGSPFAPGAAGNLATEDLVYLLERQGVRTGVDLDGVLAAARFIAGELGIQPASKVGRAGPWPAEGGIGRETIGTMDDR